MSAVPENAVRRAGQLHERQPGDEAILPVPPPLRDLLPHGGLARGSVIAVAEFGLLCMALAAAASADGAWLAIAGVPEAGMVAAADLGLDTERILLVPDPGPAWPQVTASLLDGCELVLLRPPQPATAPVRQRLEATLRRGSGVLLVAGDWPGAQVRLRVLTRQCTGLGDGHGRLRACRAEVRADGRGAGAAPRTRWLWLPAEDGTIAAADGQETMAALTGPAHCGFGPSADWGDIPVEAQSFEASGPAGRGRPGPPREGRRRLADRAASPR